MSNEYRVVSTASGYYAIMSHSGEVDCFISPRVFATKVNAWGLAHLIASGASEDRIEGYTNLARDLDQGLSSVLETEEGFGKRVYETLRTYPPFKTMEEFEVALVEALTTHLGEVGVKVVTI